jgi:RNA polymerase sigma-70 factor (ECF subfamily)
MATLIVEHLPALRRYARTLTPNLSDCEDLIQDTVERALVKAHLYQPDTNLRAWLFTMMRNVRITELRKQAVRAGFTLPMLPHSVAFVVDGRQSPEASAQALEALGLFQRLPKTDRLIMALCHQGISYGDIALRLGCPVGAIKARLHKARRRYRRLSDGGSFSPRCGA